MDKASALTILTTEHYTLQMVRTANITDATGRAGHLLSTISASMIALGFVAQVVPVEVLLTLVLVVFSGLFLIGLATLFRAVELVIEDVKHCEVPLPPECIDGQTEEQWKRAGREYPHGS